MRYLRMLGIATIAMAGFMAFAGAGTVSATTLCTATTTPDCEGAHIYQAGTSMHSTLKSGTTARFTSPPGTEIGTCTSITIKGQTANKTGTYIERNNNIFILAGCSGTTHVTGLGTFKYDWIAGTHNATIFGAGLNFTLAIFGVSCTYGAAEGGTHLGVLTGGEAPELSIAATLVKTAGGFLCPATAGWDAELIITEPHALYVTT